MTAEFGGLRLELAATFGAGREISDKVADLLAIHREAVVEGMFLQNNMPYQPKFSLTMKNVPMILHIGVKAAGGKTTMAEIENAMFEAGLHVGKEVALRYLTLYFVSGEETPDAGEGKDQAGE
jgi:hypothetical protein